MLKLLYSLSILLFIHSSVIYAEDSKVIRLYNWVDYMPQFIIDGFENETGYRVEQIYYESDELKEDLIMEAGGKGMDLIVGSSDSFMNYRLQGGIISKLDPELGPNLNNIDPFWNEQYPGLSDFAAPFFWGTLGIVYRKDLVKHKVDSWAHLLKPDESLHGKILMVEDKRDLFTPALKLLGYPSNETSYKNLAKAGELLAHQHQYVASYNYLNLSEESELITGSIWMAIAYNGDALVLKALNDEIEYVVPKEGTYIWADYIAILEASTKKSAANAFINYINTPEIAAKLAETLHYASPNKAAEKFLPEAFLNNALIYPPKEVVDKSEVIMPLKGKIMAYYNNIYNNLVSKAAM